MLCEQGLKIIEERRSIRSYEETQISDEELQTILRIAVTSPSAHNKQLYHFSVVQNGELLDEMAEAIRQVMLAGTEEQIAKASKPGYSPLYHAPTIIFISGDLKSGFNVQSDCGIAAGLIMAAASEMGVASCMIGSSVFMFRGENGADLQKRLGIPEGYQAIGAVALGYLKGEKPAEPAHKNPEELVTYLR